MKNKEVDDALHMLLHCSLYATQYETQQKQFQLVYDYIKELENQRCNRSDCGGRIIDSRKFDSVQQKIDKSLDYIDRLLESIVEKDGKYDLIAVLVTIKAILEKGDK